MGKVISVLMRPIKNYNVQSRAHKFLDGDKLKAAPRHDTTRKTGCDMAERATDTFEPLQHVQDPLLLEKLKAVYVVSSSPASKVTKDPNQRVLPSRHQIVADTESGFLEPLEVPDGKITLSQALHLLTQYDADSQSTTEISQKYKLDEELTKNILKHFTTFQVHIPNSKGATNLSDFPKMFVPKKSGEKPEEREAP